MAEKSTFASDREQTMNKNECIFCKLDKNKIVNTIIEETKNFIIMPAEGALVEGYLMLVSKKHIYSMAELNGIEKEEYLSIIEKYRNIFFKNYNKFPIIFEHSTSIKNKSSSSVSHAHTHIVNHNFMNEQDIIDKLKLYKINKKFDLEKNDKPYIFYINQEGEFFITYDFKPVSQLMRRYISKDLGIDNKYNWREYPFTENIIKTIEMLK